MADMNSMREESLIIAKHLGYSTNPSLPLLGSAVVKREVDDVVDRLFSMYCVAASAYGFDRTKAVAWLEREATVAFLSSPEREFLKTGAGDTTAFKIQIEAMWALAWAIGIVGELNFSCPCSQNFVGQLPDLKTGQSGEIFRSEAELRSNESIAKMCDLAYCLHWSIINGSLKGKKHVGAVQPYVVIERRHALEWLLSGETWDNVPMDT